MCLWFVWRDQVGCLRGSVPGFATFNGRIGGLRLSFGGQVGIGLRRTVVRAWASEMSVDDGQVQWMKSASEEPNSNGWARSSENTLMAGSHVTEISVKSKRRRSKVLHL